MSTIQKLPFYNPLDPTYRKIFPNYTLIIPVCAVGNIGQLACELLISTLLRKQECLLIGRIYSPALMAVVGPNAFAPNKGLPTTSTEVYESQKHKLVIILQRTSYYKDLKDIFIQELVNWIKESQFDNILVLSSSFAQCNPDTSQLGNELNWEICPIRSITTRSFQSNDKWLSLNLKQIPNKRTIKVVQDGLTFLPGSGITKPFIKACEKAFIPAAFLIVFCSEGINSKDCYVVANLVDKYLNLGCSGVSNSTEVIQCILGGDSVQGWTEPFSWTRDDDRDHPAYST